MISSAERVAVLAFFQMCPHHRQRENILTGLLGCVLAPVGMKCCTRCAGMALRSVSLWTVLIILAGCLALNQAWDTWLARQVERDRNPCRLRGWREFVDRTEPRRENESLILLLSNSQGYGREVASPLTYARQLQVIRQGHGGPVRVVNWSVPGWNYNDMITLTAAARRLKPSAILVVFSPRDFRPENPGGKAVSRWTSDLFYLLGDAQIRQCIPRDVRPAMADLSLWADIAVGSLWPAWRARTLPAALLSLHTPLGSFLDAENTTRWFGTPRPLRRIANPPRAGAVLPVDAYRVDIFLRVLRDAAPFVCMVNMPLRGDARADEPSSWREIEQLCRERGMRTCDLYDGIPDDGFVSKTHFNSHGHGLMAEKLSEVLP